MKRVKSFGVFQTAKVMAIILFFTSAVILIPVALLSSIAGGARFLGFPFGGGLIFFLLPFLYAIMGFIMTAISCLVYNVIAKWVGGIELEFEVVDEEKTLGE